MIPDGWSIIAIKDIADIVTGNTPPTKFQEYYGGNIPFVSPADLGSSKYIFEAEKTLTKKGFDKAKKIRKGSTLFTCIGSTIGKLGITGKLLATNQQINAVIPFDRSDDEYVYYQLSIRSNTIKKLAGTQAVPIINKTLFENQPIALPNNKVERIKIAAILAAWDKAIEVTKKLIKNSQAQKKALMQQLLAGKLRFHEFIKSTSYFETKYGPLPKDWGFIPIKEIATEVSERNKESKNYPVLSCSKYEGFINSLEYFKKKVYSDETTNYKVLQRGMFGFPSNHIEEGSIGYQDICDVGIVSPIYTVFRTNNKVCDGYLYKLLKTEHYRQIFSANTNASVDRRGSLRWKEFSKIRIPYPPIEEQEKIYSAIDQADQLCRNLEQQLTSLQNQKKALMQQLLTGKRRVKVNKAREAAA